MLAKPIIEFNISKIKENAEKVLSVCREQGMEAAFVTKGFCAEPQLIRAFIDAGYTRFCDSRLQNIMKAREAFPDIHMTLIRTPAPQEAEEVVRLCDCSIQSSFETVRAVSEAAEKAGKLHEIFINIDVGDIRDGIFSKDQLDEFAAEIKNLPGVKPVGVFTNVGCYGSVLPGVKNTTALVGIKDYLNEKYGFHMELASIGGTVAYSMIAEGRMPEGINHFRYGEAALFGEDTTGHQDLEGFHHDAVIFSAPVLERFRKPSVPVGELGRNANGSVGIYPDRGVRSRVILAAGRQDVDFNALSPLDDNMIVVGTSSDHLIIDVEDCEELPQVGDYISFRCGYMAMLNACTSEFVEKKFV